MREINDEARSESTDIVRTKTYGPCDTSGCTNEATVHHGLEEWYCDECHRAYNGRC